jgi:hypothetical protein
MSSTIQPAQFLGSVDCGHFPLVCGQWMRSAVKNHLHTRLPFHYATGLLASGS